VEKHPAANALHFLFIDFLDLEPVGPGRIEIPPAELSQLTDEYTQRSRILRSRGIDEMYGPTGELVIYQKYMRVKNPGRRI
jgi:hypothetical protein